MQNCPDESLGENSCAFTNASFNESQFLSEYSTGYYLSTLKIWINLIIVQERYSNLKLKQPILRTILHVTVAQLLVCSLELQSCC